MVMVVLWVGWMGHRILLLNPPQDGCRGCGSWNMLSSLDLRAHQYLSQFLERRRLLWSFPLFHSGFSAIQMKKALYAEISNMSKNITSGSVGFSFCSCSQSPVSPCCPRLLLWHLYPWWSLVLMLLCTHEYHILAFLWRAGPGARLHLGTSWCSISSSSSKSLSEMWSSHSETSSSTSSSKASLSSQINGKALWAENLLAILISCAKKPNWQSCIYCVTPPICSWDEYENMKISSCKAEGRMCGNVSSDVVGTWILKQCAGMTGAETQNWKRVPQTRTLYKG